MSQVVIIHIYTMIESRKMRREGHVERVRIMRNVYTIWLENLKGKDHSEELDVDGRMNLRIV
jgi:hypothetical protein